jgi:hypothetical protein
MGDEMIDERVPQPEEPDDERVESRARALDEENPTPVEDPEGQARAMLEYSDALRKDPAARNLKDGRVERRTSEDATPPPETRES